MFFFCRIMAVKGELQKMVFSENIYFLILFTLPAALNVIYNAHIRHVPVAKPDKSIELAECIIFCLTVFMCNIGLMHKEMALFAKYSLLQEGEISNFCKLTGFDYINFMIKYFIVNIVTSVGVLLIWYTLGQWIFRIIANKINKYKNRPEELKFSDVWSNVFETKDYVDMDDCIVRIEREGRLVTAGVVSIYSTPNQEEKEFMLCDTDLVKQIFEDDENLPLNLKMFKQADYEYYNIEKDVLIKFYNTESYNKAYGYNE